MALSLRELQKAVILASDRRKIASIAKTSEESYYAYNAFLVLKMPHTALQKVAPKTVRHATELATRQMEESSVSKDRKQEILDQVTQIAKIYES